MPRIGGVNIPEQKQILIALTYIFGIGLSLSWKILNEAKINPFSRAKDLTPDEINRLKEIIEKNLFGVDIEQEAVELTQLRLWLSLVVDESIEKVEPLPNLDFNICRGDSLIIPPIEERQTRLDIDWELCDALVKKIETVRGEFTCAHGLEREERKKELQHLINKLVKLQTNIEHIDVWQEFSYKYLFPDIMASGGFDIVLMNPPYIRQEDIGRLPGQNPTSYKSKIIEDVQKITDKKFVPNQQSDISVYFHIRALSLLKPGGVAVVIASSKWLDVRYGIPLQEYLLNNIAIDYVFDSTDRSFSADVNTVITVMRKVSTSPLQNIVKFVCFRTPYKDVSIQTLIEIHTQQFAENIINNEKYRMVMRTQQMLLKDGQEVEEGKKRPTYVGTKWGNLYLRAPEVYYKIIERAHNKLKKMGEVCEIKRGFTTGCDDFFYVQIIKDDEKTQPNLVYCKNGLNYYFWIEKEFLAPVVTTPREISTYSFDINSLHYHVFLCKKDKKDLQNTYAYKYIEWGEKSSKAQVEVIKGKDKGKKVQICKLEGIKCRKRWWQLPDLMPSRVLLIDKHRNRIFTPLCSEEVLMNAALYPLYAEQSLSMWLYLNSTFFILLKHLYGREEGGGAIRCVVYEYKLMPILDPLPPLEKDFKQLETFVKREPFNILPTKENQQSELEQQDRKELDDIVLKELGFTDPNERAQIQQELYEAVRQLVKDRIRKGESSPREIKKLRVRKTKISK